MSNRSSKVIDNMTKYDTYKNLYDKLYLAIENEFYFEACLISCSIIEDRINSMFKYMNVQPNRREVSDKIKQIKAIGKVEDKQIEEIFDEQYVQSLHSWIAERNKIVHGIANSKYDIRKYKRIAIKGMELAKETSNKVNRYKAIQASKVKEVNHNRYDVYKDGEKNYYYCDKGLEAVKDNLIKIEKDQDKFFDKRKARLLCYM